MRYERGKTSMTTPNLVEAIARLRAFTEDFAERAAKMTREGRTTIPLLFTVAEAVQTTALLRVMIDLSAAHEDLVLKIQDALRALKASQGSDLVTECVRTRAEVERLREAIAQLTSRDP
jgi:hypothetical protein